MVNLSLQIRGLSAIPIDRHFGLAILYKNLAGNLAEKGLLYFILAG